MMVHPRILLVLLVSSVIAWFAGPESRFFIILAFWLFVPGYLLEQFVPVSLPRLPFLRPALWIGLSLSTIALFYEAITLAGVALSQPVLLLLTGLGAAGVVWSMVRHRAAHIPPRVSWETWGAWGALLAVFVLTVWTRFVQVEDLVLPAWVDSVHHALITRVAAEKGMAPYSLRPYLPVDSMPYHWGYHVFTATVLRLTELELPQVLLWEGQILNALHVLTCAALATYFWRHPGAGIAAGISVGLISIMPAYYVSWGRYTHLTGLLILPSLVIAWHMLLHTPSRTWLLYAALLCAGLSLVHFRVLVLAACMLAVVSLVWAMDKPWSTIVSRLGYAAAFTLLVVVLAAPWLWVLLQKILLPAVDAPRSLTSGGNYVKLNEGLLWAGENRLVAALAIAGAWWGIWHRSRVALIGVGSIVAFTLAANPWLVSYIVPAIGLVLVGWALSQARFHVSSGNRSRQTLTPQPGNPHPAPLQHTGKNTSAVQQPQHHASLPVICIVGVAGLAMLLLNPWVVQLPFFWLVTNDVITISLFVPLSLLIGGLVSLLDRKIERIRLPYWSGFVRYLARAVLVVLLGAGALWGASNLRSVINPVTALVKPADKPAIAWVREHTPPDARFLINAAGWYPGAQRGVDGGYWLLPLTGRWTTTPPASFTYASPQYVQQIEELATAISHFGPEQQEYMYEMLKQWNITHIYLRQGAGPLTPELFSDRARYEQVYDEGGVVIFAVKP
jgi:hypothetical protein